MTSLFILNIEIIIDKPYFAKTLQNIFIKYISEKIYDDITIKWIYDDKSSKSNLNEYYAYSNKNYEKIYEETKEILKKAFFLIKNIYPEFGNNWEYKFTLKKNICSIYE
jgi:ABC-type Zn2+ transport system substrate-binding protein/surface adhesin